MAFLGWLVKAVLDYVVGKVTAFLALLAAAAGRHKAIDEQSGTSVEPLKQAKTAKEIDEASDDALNGF